MIVYAVSIEDNDSGCVDWYMTLPEAQAAYEQALVDYPDDEVNLWAEDFGDDANEDEWSDDVITDTVDAVMWQRSYDPIRWRAAAPGRHNARPHDTPPTDARPA